MREIAYDDGKGFEAGSCPVCGCDDVSCNGGTCFSSLDTQQMSFTCDSCGAEWVENYWLMNAIVTKE